MEVTQCILVGLKYRDKEKLASRTLLWQLIKVEMIHIVIDESDKLLYADIEEVNMYNQKEDSVISIQIF